jgi:diguanylate cyclase (GGDEF)-like protein
MVENRGQRQTFGSACRHLSIDIIRRMRLDLFTVAIILEMIGINTFSTYYCSKKKQTAIGSPVFVVAITAALTVFLILILTRLPGFDHFDGKGIFIPFGLLYLLPMLLVFDQSVKHMLIILSSSWIYTTFIFSVSVRIGYQLSADSLSATVLIIQTIIYVFTVPFYNRFVKNTFVYIHKNISSRMLNSLLVISLSWFLLLFLLNYTFVTGTPFVLELFILIAASGNALLSFKLVYDLVSLNNKAATLSENSKTDPLTRLKNRQGMYEDALYKIDKREPFSIIFADLDAFKSVNDNYGHAIGDVYLVEFVRSVKELLQIDDGFYRLHGDEFVIITAAEDPSALCNAIKQIEFDTDTEGMFFMGLSLGCSAYPTDGEKLNDLLYAADLRMYQVKKDHHKMQ